MLLSCLLLKERKETHQNQNIKFFTILVEYLIVDGSVSWCQLNVDQLLLMMLQLEHLMILIIVTLLMMLRLLVMMMMRWCLAGDDSVNSEVDQVGAATEEEETQADNDPHTPDTPVSGL